MVTDGLRIRNELEAFNRFLEPLSALTVGTCTSPGSWQSLITPGRTPCTYWAGHASVGPVWLCAGAEEAACPTCSRFPAFGCMVSGGSPSGAQAWSRKTAPAVYVLFFHLSALESPTFLSDLPLGPSWQRWTSLKACSSSARTDWWNSGCCSLASPSASGR